MERLQKIVEKLEAKLQPLHDENQQLKAKLEELQLDHELAVEQAHAAELELAESESRSKRIKELSEQVEALETLKHLSDELERDQREEIAHLEEQLALARSELEQQISTGESRIQTPLTDPSDALKQELSLLKLQLEAANYELRVQQIGLLEFLNETVPFDLEKMRYMLATYGTASDDERLRSLFDLFKVGTIGSRDLSESIKQVTNDLNLRSQKLTKFNPDAARVYLLATTKDDRVKILSDANLARAFDDPTLIDTLREEKEPSDTGIVEIKPIEPAESSEEVETLKLKIEILSEKATRAAHFAASLNEAKTNAEKTQKQAKKLETHITELRDQLKTREAEITALKAAQAPDLDTITYQHTLGLLSDTIKLLHSRDPPLVLAPLKIETARNLSAFAGTKIVQQVWEAIDTFEVPKKRKTWVEQTRKLSLIDA